MFIFLVSDFFLCIFIYSDSSKIISVQYKKEKMRARVYSLVSEDLQFPINKTNSFSEYEDVNLTDLSDKKMKLI